MKKNLVPAIGDKTGMGRNLTNEEKSSFMQKNCFKLYDYDEYHEENLLTNFGADQLSIYETAVKDFGDTSLYIDNQAYDRRGNLIENYYALRTKSKKDRSDFWKLFRGIRDGISA